MDALQKNEMVEVTYVYNCPICYKETHRRTKMMHEDDAWEKYPNHCSIIKGQTVLDYVELSDFCSAKCEDEYHNAS